MQLILQSRALKPTGWQIQAPSTKEDVVALQAELMNRALNRTVTAEDFALGNQALRTFAQILCPRPVVQVTQTVTQSVDVQAEMERSKRSREALARMNETGRDAVYEYITAMAGNETRPSSSKP
jgi:hypothetical protein